jgi:SAM-dependent methyltransferase
MSSLCESFVCPKCTGPLSHSRNQLQCEQCSDRFHVVADSIPIFLHEDEYPEMVPDPGTPFLEALELAEELHRTPGTFHDLMDKYYEKLLGVGSELHEYYRQIAHARRVGEVSDEISMISLGMNAMNLTFPQVRRAVEFGSGWGFSLAAAAKSRAVSHLLTDARFCGFDLNPAILVIARRLFTDLNLEGIDLAIADARKPLPFPAKSVDLVYSNGVVEHVFPQDALMEQISRILSDDSVLHFLIPNRYMVHPEPHFNIRYVGFVPRKLQKKYVSWMLKIPETRVDTILSYSPHDLNSLMGRNFDHDFLAAIPFRPAGWKNDDLVVRNLGLLGAHSYHCMVRRYPHAHPADDMRGRLQLTNFPGDGSMRCTRLYEKVA